MFGEASGTGGIGVQGYSALASGVVGVSGASGIPNLAGVWGKGVATSRGVVGESATGTGVVGFSGAAPTSVYLNVGVHGAGCNMGAYGEGGYVGVYGDGGVYAGIFNGNVYVTGSLTCGGLPCGTASDRRLKTKIDKLPYGLAEVLQLAPVRYEMLAHPGIPRSGLVAQDVQSLVPEVVYTIPGDEGLLAVAYTELIPVLIRAIQEQEAKIDALEAKALIPGIGTLSTPPFR